jgi:hypothetical protein
MKTKFLPKLLLLSLFCVALNSCTADEILSYTQGDVSSTSDSTVSTTTDGTTTDSSTIVEPGTEPIVPKPK